MQTVERTVEEQIDELAEIYRFREPGEVRAYLTENPDLIPLVREAAAKIPEFVTPVRPLEIEVFRNPEEEEDTAIVPVVIVDRHGPSVLPQMNRLIREWLVDAGRAAGGRFIVSDEYH